MVRIFVRLPPPLRFSALCALAVTCQLALGQEPATLDKKKAPRPAALDTPAPPVVMDQTPEKEQAVNKLGAGGVMCLEPPDMVRWQDYDGPFAKFVGTLGSKLDRPSVHLPHYMPGDVLCSFSVKDKFVYFVRDSSDPVTILQVMFFSSLDQWQNNEPQFGKGLKGYAHRWGANQASDATGRFFSEFFFPTILAEDPRYYRLGEGGGGRRLGHALAHAFVAHTNGGKRMANFSEWAGTTSGVLLSDVYHPHTTHGAGGVAWAVSFNVLQDTGFDVLREFWPEIARKFHVPFRALQLPKGRPLDNAAPAPAFGN